MPVRLRITLLFVLLVFIILSLVCGGIYYFSYQARIDNIRKRLTNRAITTARLLSQREIFDQAMVQRIDSSTTLALKNKTVQAYDENNRLFYSYSNRYSDTLSIEPEIISKAREKGSYYFSRGIKEAVAYADEYNPIIIITAGVDEDGRESLRHLRNILLLSFLVGNIFVLVGGYVFSGRLLKPIREIAEDVAEISAQNLTRRIKTGKTRDEWYHLSHTLNELLNRLQESFESQRRFVSNASHELSTPLTSISSQLEVCLQREREASEYRKVLQSVHHDVVHMSKLTQTLLEFAKASGNAGGLEIDLVRIDEILLRMPAEIGRLNKDYTVKLSFNELPEDEENLLVFGNEPLLLTAIRNIVLNACKYSTDRTADVSLGVENHDIRIEISDNGIGIPKEDLPYIFYPFYRVEENQQVGFGLGLSLAERIIKLHKGTIEVQSETGKGTRFTLRLPAARNLRAQGNNL